MKNKERNVIGQQISDKKRQEEAKRHHFQNGAALNAAAFAARIGSGILSAAAGILIFLLLAYGVYCVWDMYSTYAGAFPSEELLSYKPQTSTDGTNPSLEELMAINPDVCGWITVDDTNIDYPIVQGEDNLTYVNLDIYGEFSFTGAIFLDSTLSRDFSNTYTLLYGHHVSGGGMFADVTRFLGATYFENHTSGTLYLPEATYTIEFFAVIEADAYDKTIYSPLRWDGEDISALLTYIQEMSAQYRDIGLEADEKIIGLSTCAEGVTNGRAVLYGRLAGQ